MQRKATEPIKTIRNMTIDGHTLHYLKAGSGSGVPLVLIHGYGVSGHIWQPMLPYLAQEHEVFAVDLPGYGRSTLSGPWQLRAMAPLLAEWLRQMHLPPVALIGQSMGGAIAIHLTAHAPELVEQLVLISSAGLPLQAPLSSLALRSARSFFQTGNGRYPLALMRDLLQPRLRILWQTAQEMVRSNFHAELATIMTPTLIIWGERDLLLPIALGHALSAALPHASFVTLPESGHRPMLAQPERLSEIILEFLAHERRSHA